jgi:hypothetical protein
MVDGTAYLGHDSNGKIMGWDGWDDLGVDLERRFSAAVQLDEPLSIDTLWLWANAGQSTVLSGTGSARWSKCAGRGMPGSPGPTGRTRPWGMPPSAGPGNTASSRNGGVLGMFDAPGAMFEFRLTDPVPFRLSKVAINDPGGGRSRG